MVSGPLSRGLSGSLTSGLTHTLSKGVSFNLDAFMAAQSDGLYFDTTKTDRFFQENTGQTLADDAGEAIGLALDQRTWGGKTLAEVLAGQPNLAVNGTFDTDTNWFKVLATISGGVATLDTPTGAYSAVSQIIPVVAGRAYHVQFRIVSITSGSIRADIGGISGVISGKTAVGTYSAIVIAASATMDVAVVRGGTGMATLGSVDNIVVREVPGKHGVQATGTLKPLRQATGAKFDGNDDNWLTNYSAGAENFIVALVDVPVTLSASQWICGATGTADDRAYFAITAAGQIAAGTGTSALIQGPDFRGRSAVIGISFNSNTRRLFGDNSLIVEGAFTGSLPALPWRVGSNNSNGTAAGFFGGSIKRIVAGRQFLDLVTFLKIRNALLAT